MGFSLETLENWFLDKASHFSNLFNSISQRSDRISPSSDTDMSKLGLN